MVVVVRILVSHNTSGQEGWVWMGCRTSTLRCIIMYHRQIPLLFRIFWVCSSTVCVVDWIGTWTLPTTTIPRRLSVMPSEHKPDIVPCHQYMKERVKHKSAVILGSTTHAWAAQFHSPRVNLWSRVISMNLSYQVGPPIVD